MTLPPNATRAEVDLEKKAEEEEPDINPWAGIVMIVVTVGIMAATAEWVSVDSPSGWHAEILTNLAYSYLKLWNPLSAKR